MVFIVRQKANSYISMITFFSRNAMFNVRISPNQVFFQ